jgi:hypothetical protein
MIRQAFLSFEKWKILGEEGVSNIYKFLWGNGYSVLLVVCSAICPASFGRILPIFMGQNILVNEWIIFMSFIL